MGTIGEYQWTHLRSLQARVSDAVRERSTLEEAAQACVEALYRDLRESIVLARIYAALPMGSLPVANQTFVRALAAATEGVGPLSEDTPVLSLLGTRGVVTEWNDRRRSKGHVGIPLVAASFGDAVPMLGRLLKDLGVDARWFDEVDTPTVEKRLADGFAGVSYVRDAATAVDAQGRRMIPAREFVATYGVKTVFGMGGSYVGGTIATLVVFTRETIERPQIERLASLLNVFRAATTPLVMRRRFFVEG
jgi:hypothetical protein